MSSTARTLEALYSVGHRLIALERHRDALSLFRTMLVVEPRDERGWLALATCHEALEEPEKALALYGLAEAACEGKAVRCMIARARLHQTLGSTEEAAIAYSEAIRLAEAQNDHDAFSIAQSEMGAS